LTSGKGHATPSRAEQEAARKRPLVPDTKEAKARAKADLAAQRDKARVGMAAGDERYLTARDKGPQRRFARDYVDSRIQTIFGGTTEIMKDIIGRDLGL
jgi:alkylation response protein AidB-like acyl-CoA dehydrogenase